MQTIWILYGIFAYHFNIKTCQDSEYVTGSHKSSTMINRRLFFKTAMASGVVMMAEGKMPDTDLLSFHVVSDENTEQTVDKEIFHIFLLMGQSNMAGYGTILPEDEKEIEGSCMLRDIARKAGEYSWIPAKQPIHSRLKSDRFGLAGPFAKSYRELYPQTTVGLIPMALGGTPITKMIKGTPLYQEAIDKALWAKKRGMLKAMLWHQGESDTVSQEQADLYENRLTQLIQDIRADLNEPDLKVIVGNLAEFYGTGTEHSAPQRVKLIEKVKDSLHNVSKNLTGVGFVESKCLRSHDHHQVHFDRESYIIFGKRYLDVYWNMINQQK